MSQSDERAALERQLAILQELKNRKLELYQPYEKQIEFHGNGTSHRERCFMAGNQLGKTVAGGAEMAFHLTGHYPDWWPGKRFDHPVRAWAAGNSSETTRDNPQRVLMGDTPDQWGQGYIPKSAILDIKRAKGVSDAVDICIVKHKSGGSSFVKFKSYDQGREKWQGVPVHVVWFDEEPPKDIYSEGTTRTNATHGISYITATPLLGMTEVVRMFYPTPADSSKALTNMTIYDAKHYSQEQIDEIIAKTPPHELDARISGKPMLGQGLVFPVARAILSVDSFPIPNHWKRIIGLDFGWDHPTAAANCAWDVDNDIFYVVGIYKESRQVIPVNAAAIRGWGPHPIAWPHDGFKHDMSSGQQIRDQYAQCNLLMLPEHATNAAGGYGVEAPIQEMLEAMLEGRFKVFSHLTPLFDEMEQYHRKDGKIVAAFDDAISATRYAWMMRRFARPFERKRMKLTRNDDYSPFNDGRYLH